MPLWLRDLDRNYKLALSCVTGYGNTYRTAISGGGI